MNILFILLQDSAMGAQGQSSWSFWIMMILIFVVMWLFMIRPQQKKQKELEKQRDAMRPGQKVVTAGGLHGKLKSIDGDIFQVEIAKDVVIRIDKSSVFVEPEAAPRKDDKPKKEDAKKEDKKDDKKDDEQKA